MSDLLRKLLEDRKELLSEEDNLPIDNPEVKDENPEEPDEFNVIEEPEQEGIPDDFEKVYLGKSGDKHYYIIAKRNEEGVVEDLELTDQEGNKVYSAKENELEVTNLGSFIREVLNEEDIPEVETSVVMQYLVPDIQDEIEAEEEEDEELETPEEIPGEEEKPEDNSKVPTPNDTEKKKLPFESKIKEGTGEDIYQKALEEAIRQMELYVGRSIPFKAIKNSIKRTYQLSDEEAEGIIYDAADEEHLDLGSQPNFDESKVKETNVKDTPEHIKVNCKACGKRVSDDTKLNTEGLCPKCARNMPKWNESKDRLPGGKADKKKPEDFDKAQLEIGIEIEMEHTDDPAVAQEIAMDHLTEDPEYYTHLRKMEMDAKNGKGFAKESKETNEARMGVDYIKGVKSSVKTAIQALKDKDYEAAAKALEDVADDAGDAAKAAKKMKREVDAKEEASKEETEEVKESQLTETVIKDDKGNTFTITKTVDEKTKNTILQINKRDFSFTPDFVKVFETDENGELSENGAKELALETIKHLEESEYANLIASGKVKESKVNENEGWITTEEVKRNGNDLILKLSNGQIFNIRVATKSKLNDPISIDDIIDMIEANISSIEIEESKMKESDKSQAEKTYLAKIEAALEKAKTELEKNPDSKELQKRVQSLEAALDEDYNECASKNESIKIAIQAGLIKEGTELMYNSKKCKVTAITESNVSLTVADEAGSSMNVNINGNNGGVNIDPTGMISITPANVGMGFEEAPVEEIPAEEELENPEEEKEEENPFESKTDKVVEKSIFTVNFTDKDGKSQTTKVKALDEAEAKIMISKKPTVKSVNDVKRIRKVAEKKVDEGLRQYQDNLIFVKESGFSEGWDVIKTLQGRGSATVIFTFDDEESAIKAGEGIAAAVGGKFLGKTDPRKGDRSNESKIKEGKLNLKNFGKEDYYGLAGAGDNPAVQYEIPVRNWPKDSSPVTTVTVVRDDEGVQVLADEADGRYFWSVDENDPKGKTSDEIIAAINTPIDTKQLVQIGFKPENFESMPECKESKGSVRMTPAEKEVKENKLAFGGERAVRIAESILGLSKHVIEDDAVDVGKMVQITNKHSGRVMIVESKVQKMDKTKGCLVDGDWYSEKFYNIYTI